MIKKKIVIKAINKARWNGWRFKYWRRRNGLCTSPVTTNQPKKAHASANSHGSSANVLLRKLNRLNIPVSGILQDQAFCRFLFGLNYRTHFDNPLYKKEPIKYLKKFYNA